MRYSEIEKCECRNGLGWGVSLYTQGCHFHCKGCFNSETWNFNGGKEYNQKILETILELIEPDYITRFSILGGEPLERCNWNELSLLLLAIKFAKPSIKIWLYTGYELQELKWMIEDKNYHYAESLKEILDCTDVLVEGQFQEDKKDLTYPFAGSTNQRVIDMNKTREQGKIVLLDI